jgi:hypothetical protein
MAPPTEIKIRSLDKLSIREYNLEVSNLPSTRARINGIEFKRKVLYNTQLYDLTTLGSSDIMFLSQILNSLKTYL